jgi:hypothetical protein
MPPLTDGDFQQPFDIDDPAEYDVTCLGTRPSSGTP